MRLSSKATFYLKFIHPLVLGLVLLYCLYDTRYPVTINGVAIGASIVVAGLLFGLCNARKDDIMSTSVDVSIAKVQRSKKRSTIFLISLWFFVAFSALIDMSQIYWVMVHHHVTLAEMIAVGGFAAGGLFTVDYYPSYLVAGGIRCHLLVVKLFLGIIFAGLFTELSKCQDLALQLFRVHQGAQ